MTHSITRMALALMTLAAVAMVAPGCNTDSNIAQLSGKITVDGEPVEGLQLTFDPQFDGGTQAMAFTNASGNYTAMLSAQREGIMVGEYVLSISGEITDEGGSTTVADIPESYSAEQSTTTVDVEPGSNTFDLDIATE